MPYYITDSASGCSGWATIKEDGEVIGCHTTKQAAIDQMVAVSIAEDMEPGGERADAGDLVEGDFVSWNSSGGRARGRIEHIMTEGTLGVPDSDFSVAATPDDPAALIRIWERVRGGWRETEVLVGHKFSTLTKIQPLEEPSEEVRQVELDVPQYIREAARRGLDYYGQGRGGDGLVARTIREARQMARGEISEDKVIRANAWGKRHLVDLEAPQNSDPDDDNFPGAGAVAFYLWGIDPLDPEPAMDWFEDAAELIRGEEDDMEDESDDMDDDEARARRLLVLERLSKLFLDK